MEEKRALTKARRKEKGLSYLRKTYIQSRESLQPAQGGSTAAQATKVIDEEKEGEDGEEKEEREENRRREERERRLREENAELRKMLEAKETARREEEKKQTEKKQKEKEEEESVEERRRVAQRKEEEAASFAALQSDLLHECRVIASMLEDRATGTIHHVSLEGILARWKRYVPKFFHTRVEDDINTVLSMNHRHGIYLREMTNILSRRVTREMLVLLKAATVDYLRRDHHTATAGVGVEGTTATRSFGVGAVADVNAEPCFLSYEESELSLVVRPVGALGLIQARDVARISLPTIVSMAFAGTRCRVVLSIEPYCYEFNFGRVQAVLSFVRQLQRCMGEMEVPMMDLPIGGGHTDQFQREGSLAENYLNLVAATHGL
jgi:hypothetical protein